MNSFITEPHGEHEIRLLEDAEEAADRIYDIVDRHDGRTIGFLGSELDSLCLWWSAEKQRRGKPPDVSVEN